MKYLKPDVKIESDFIVNDKICKYYIDFYYNLYASKDDVRFSDCHEGKNKNSNTEINENVDKFLSLRSTDDLFNFMKRL